MSYWDSYLDEVDTENDWPEEAKSIADIERLLRCPICKGIIDGAVILSTCGHSCCSLCLNRFLATQSRCPICRTPCTESNIVRNLLLEEVCHQFSVTRSSLLLLANTISEKISQKRLIYATEMELRRKKKEEQQQMDSKENEIKESEKKEELIDLSKECDSEPSPGNNKSENEGDTNSEDSDFVPVILKSTKKKNKKSEMSAMQTISTDSQAHEYLTCQCPICNCFYREKDIERHVNHCLESKDHSTFTGFSSQDSKLQKLPILVGRLLSPSELKKKLMEYQIYEKGLTKQEMINRLRNYTIFHNAECDKSHPQPKWKLVQTFLKNEKQKNKKS